MTRHTITNKQNRAKCMAWRGGQRCNRKAVAVVTYRKPTINLDGRQARCAECAQNADVTRVEKVCERGFTVHVNSLDQMHQRHYQEIVG